MAVKKQVDERALIDPWDRSFHALAAEPRRQIVASLIEAPRERDLSLPEAANPPFLLQDPEQLNIELVHEHLPVLADGEHVEWFREPFRVRRGAAFEEVSAVLESVLERAEEVPDQMTDGYRRLAEQRLEGVER